MSVKRYAKALIERRGIEFDEWMEGIRSQNEGAVPKDFINRTAKTVLRKCDPKQFLLSHATIVASVDTFAPKGVKTGRLMNRGCQIDVRWPEFRVKPECHPIINNNGDAWERSLLLSTYRTFIGAHNYLEHIQLPELSKGFIVDAIARDLGKSCYIDILVGTDRKHNQLVSDIISGAITGLSMGCWEASTPVTLDDGSTIPICDVLPDMNVLTQSGNIRRVENLQIRQNRWDMVDLKIVGLPHIKCTSNHGIYIAAREEIEYKKACSGKKNPIPRAYNFQKIEAGQLKIGDIVATPIPRDIIDPGISESDARFLGLYMAEGYKIDITENTFGIGFCIGAHEFDIINEIETKIDQISWAAKETKWAVGGGRIPLSTTKRFARNGCYLVSRSHSARLLVDKFIHGRHAKDKLLDKTVLLWPKHLQLAFLGGVIDGDGCVSTRNTKYETKSVHVSTRNFNLANQLFYMALRCGIVTTISSAKRKGTKKVPNGAGIDYQLKFRNDSAESIPSSKVKSFIGQFNSEISRLISEKDRWIAGDHMYARVQSLRIFDYEGFVYDLQVDDDHTYTAGHIGVSNCISLFTTCTKCGNVASDDAQLCPCILYDGKLSTFVDEAGQSQILGELIGHVSVPNSNQFIEASWVRNPAFRGAVRRNLLNADVSQIASKMGEAKWVYELRSQIPEIDGIKKAASSRRADQGQGQSFDSVFGDDADQGDGQDQGQGAQGQGGGQGQGQDSSQGQGQDSSQGQQSPDASKPAEPKTDKVDSMLDKITEQLLTSITQKLTDKLAPKPEDVGTVTSPPIDLEAGNDNLVRSTVDFTRLLRKKFSSNKRLVQWAERAYKIRSANSGKLSHQERIILSWIEDRCQDRIYPPSLYKTAIQVGSINNYPSKISFIAACNMKLGRNVSQQEGKFLIWKAKV